MKRSDARVVQVELLESRSGRTLHEVGLAKVKAESRLKLCVIRSMLTGHHNGQT